MFRRYQKHQFATIIPVNEAVICKIIVRLVVKPNFLFFSSKTTSVSYKSEVVSCYEDESDRRYNQISQVKTGTFEKQEYTIM